MIKRKKGIIEMELKGKKLELDKVPLFVKTTF
jgi:hypothetical protein